MALQRYGGRRPHGRPSDIGRIQLANCGRPSVLPALSRCSLVG